MGYYTIRMNPLAVSMCTIIFPWGTIEISGSTNIFQTEMMDLMEALEYVQAYIDDPLVITRVTLKAT